MYETTIVRREKKTDYSEMSAMRTPMAVFRQESFRGLLSTLPNNCINQQKEDCAVVNEKKERV